MIRPKIERCPVYVDNGTSTPVEHLACTDDAVKRLERYVLWLENENKRVFIPLSYALKAISNKIITSKNITDDEAIDVLAILEPLQDGLKKEIGHILKSQAKDIKW